MRRAKLGYVGSGHRLYGLVVRSAFEPRTLHAEDRAQTRKLTCELHVTANAAIDGVHENQCRALPRLKRDQRGRLGTGV